MSIHKKKGRWYVAVYQGIKDGVRQYEWSDGFDKKDDAQLHELELKKVVIESHHKVCDKESFIYIADRWIGVREKTVAPSTYRQNSNYYNAYIKKAFENKLVKDIEPLDITDFMLTLDFAPETVVKTMNILKLIFDFALEMHCIRSNPCLGVKKPSIRKKKRKTWNQQMINKFLTLRDTKDATCYTALWILFATGMRPGEVCGLRWGDWHGDYFMPTFGIDEKREQTDLKNVQANSEVYIDVDLEMHLAKLLKAHKALHLEKGVKFTDESYINCLMPDFRPMTTNYLHQRFDKIVIKNGLPEIRLYDARHSLGTNMMRDGENPKVVSEILRHSTVKTTLDNYSHVDKEMHKKAIHKYNDKIG